MGHLYLKSSVFHRRLLNLKPVATVPFFTALCLILLAITPAKLTSKGGTNQRYCRSRISYSNKLDSSDCPRISQHAHRALAPVTTLPFNTDNRTRIMFFATNLTFASRRGCNSR